MPEKEFKPLIFKMINDLKEDSYIQMNEVRNSIQYLDKKLSKMDEKSRKDTEILKKKWKFWK
jgi:hypothetical protein